MADFVLDANSAGRFGTFVDELIDAYKHEGEQAEMLQLVENLVHGYINRTFASEEQSASVRRRMITPVYRTGNDKLFQELITPLECPLYPDAAERLGKYAKLTGPGVSNNRYVAFR